MVEDNAESFYAIDAGFFKRNGIDPQLTTLRAGALQMSAVVSGQLDMAEASTVSFGSAISRGVGLIAVIPAAKFTRAKTLLDRAEEKFHVIGRVVKGDHRVQYT